jgi:hypothetical protein
MYHSTYVVPGRTFAGAPTAAMFAGLLVDWSVDSIDRLRRAEECKIRGATRYDLEIEPMQGEIPDYLIEGVPEQSTDVPVPARDRQEILVCGERVAQVVLLALVIIDERSDTSRVEKMHCTTDYRGARTSSD